MSAAAFNALTAPGAEVEAAFTTLLRHQQKVEFARRVDRDIARMAAEPRPDTAPDMLTRRHDMPDTRKEMDRGP